MTPVRLFLIAALTGGFLTACKGARPVPKEIAEAPRATSFPHSKHAEVAACTDCHGEIAKSTRLGQAPLPGAAKCDECHDSKAADAPGQAIRNLKPREAQEHQINFNHADHLGRIKDKEPCATCHKAAKLPEPGPARDWS